MCRAFTVHVHVHAHAHVSTCVVPALMHTPCTPRAHRVQVLRLAAQATDGSPLSALGMLGKAHGVQTPGHGVQTPGVMAPHPSSLAGAPAAPTGTGGAARPLLLTVQRVVLSSWVVELQAVQALHVVVRGELVTGSTQGSGSTQGPRAPLMLRSATQRKRGATLELNLSAMLVGEASCIEIELLHEPLSSGGASHVLGSAQLELGRLYQSTAAQPLQYELPLYDARAMHVATLQLLSQPHAKLALAPPPAAVSLAAVAASGAQAAAMPLAPAAVAGGAVAGGAVGAPVAGEMAVAAQVQVLEAELAQARQRAEGLQRENLRLAQRSHTQQQHGGAMEQGRHGAGGGARGGTRMDPADWRKAELDSLERSLARLQRHTGLQASSSMPGLEIAKLEMARMVEEAAGGRGAQGAALELGVQGGAMGVQQQGAMLTV